MKFERKEILKEINESQLDSWELGELAKDIKILERRKLDEESIETKKREIETLEKRISEIDSGSYQEPIEEDNYYDNR